MHDEEYWDEDGSRRVLKPRLENVTVVHDKKNNVQVMQIQGVVVLPVGAQVELLKPNVSATVIGVRLLAGNDSHPVGVCLDVEVPEGYYKRVQQSNP
jgi:NMD protein affecting ribosome stability and mRNA decay